MAALEEAKPMVDSEQAVSTESQPELSCWIVLRSSTAVLQATSVVFCESFLVFFTVLQKFFFFLKDTLIITQVFFSLK